METAMPIGKFVLVVGPSCAGKTTLVDAMLAEHPSTVRLVTSTSRPPRSGERDGVDYHFLTRQEFERRRESGEFFEWFENYGNLYGSSRIELDKLLACHPVVFGILDVRGALVTKSARPEAMAVFVDTANAHELRRRLSLRPNITKEDVGRRVSAAARERRAPRQHPDVFSLVVVNRDGHLEEATAKFRRFVVGLMAR